MLETIAHNQRSLAWGLAAVIVLLLALLLGR
jgi:hypothetical protein